MSWGYKMRCVVQRVKSCKVKVDEEIVGAIERGLLVYVGVSSDDTDRDVDYCAEKVLNMRIYPDEKGKMNLSVLETGGGVLAVSQFTLYGDMRKGRRPSYNRAAQPDKAAAAYEKFLNAVRNAGIDIQSGRFQTKMEVSYINEGPVTILVDSEKNF